MNYINFLLLVFYREKEDDLERRYQLLIRELRSIIAIEGNVWQNNTFLVSNKS